MPDRRLHLFFISLFFVAELCLGRVQYILRIPTFHIIEREASVRCLL